ncbi:MAG: hypothetical protein EBU90_28690 [Proteobacteria bacterium]|nr:hypothetical protein [Pseudomonadota bacterium]
MRQAQEAKAKARAQEAEAKAKAETPAPAQAPSQHGARIGRSYPSTQQQQPQPQAPKPQAPKPQAPKPEQKGPNWFQRQASQFQAGRAETSGSPTAQRIGRVIGSGEKIAKGGAEWTAKNLLAKPIGLGLGLGAVGGGAFGAYKGTEALVKKFGPGILKAAQGMVNPNLSNSYELNGDDVIVECLNLISNYLIAEKYASDEKSAIRIMENMGEKWTTEILEAYLAE